MSLFLGVYIASTSFASEVDKDHAFNSYESVAKISNSETISGNDNGFLRKASRTTAVCLDYLEIDKRFLKNQWRAVGETEITPTVTWKIAMELELYKNDHIVATAGKTKNNTSSYTGRTKWCSGKSSDTWSSEGIFRVFDDNGVKIHEQELYVDM
ncbi:hypothetical protein [Lacrimispora sphenoides]|uniref:hypothetical protein n=1 Tax=Lacrimispora sphenoides TaxID=29370 RepID=UPI00115FCDC9|nr:hypothetical protein [Lacrimispora sphenoides]